MARFIDIALAILFITNAACASGHNCSADQFKCKYGCIYNKLTCNGYSECSENCRNAGRSYEQCKNDTGDEDNCDYPALIPLDKRIPCEMDVSYQVIKAAVEDEQNCNRFTSCVWDPTTSTCFRKWPISSNGLKCKNCYEHQNSDTWHCYDSKERTTCDIALAQLTNDNVTSIHDQRCMLDVKDGRAHCATAKYCEDNKASASCCTGDYCNMPPLPTNFTCDSFTCKYSCLDDRLTCNGDYDCKKMCEDLGGSKSECDQDTGDEENCDYPTLIPHDKRVPCKRWSLDITDEQKCHDANCVWDSPTSTCYKKQVPSPGALSCKYCEYHYPGVWNCNFDKAYTICDVYLAEHKADPDMYDIHAQRCMIEGGTVRCSTERYCDVNQARVSCCDSDYCNVPPLPKLDHCEANQFRCKYGCIDKGLTCNGQYDCRKACTESEGGSESACMDDTYDEDCDFARIIPPDKRVPCKNNSLEITDEQICHDWNCVWDSPTSTCYKKQLPSPGALSCKYCEKLSGFWNCGYDKMDTICDVYLVGHRADAGMADIHDQRCMVKDGMATCATKKYCEDNKASASCCDSDYCNVPPLPTSFGCENNQFKCKYGCIGKGLTCNGQYDCRKACTELEGGSEYACMDDTYDEDNCDYSKLIPPDKRVPCTILNRMITDVQKCHTWNCVWDSPTSTCYSKLVPSPGALSCKYCTMQGSGFWKCRNDKKHTVCDAYLAGWKADQRCMVEGGMASCTTKTYCENHKATAICCDSDYCNVFGVVEEPLLSKGQVGKKVKPAKSPSDDYALIFNSNKDYYADNDEVITEAPSAATDNELKETDEDHGSTIKSDIIACVIALTLAMIAA